MGALSAWLDCSREAKIVIASVMKLSDYMDNCSAIMALGSLDQIRAQRRQLYFQHRLRNILMSVHYLAHCLANQRSETTC